MPSAWSNVTFN
ncbi:hypothetical protein D021_1703A, partial [Vibrio parahaemolyticus 10296]